MAVTGASAISGSRQPSYSLVTAEAMFMLAATEKERLGLVGARGRSILRHRSEWWGAAVGSDRGTAPRVLCADSTREVELIATIRAITTTKTSFKMFDKQSTVVALIQYAGC
mmetsp:Transcript_28857/g.81285  ORF Transcript_28857/g.81285 Transcript_28857/m.81285 type:complete len:112 (+) Transcript_28857:637-972(+)